jgi:hypothetical protein
VRPVKLLAMRDMIRSWNLPKRSDKEIDDLSRMFNPIIRGWLRYYGRNSTKLVALYCPLRLRTSVGQESRKLVLAPHSS